MRHVLILALAATAVGCAAPAPPELVQVDCHGPQPGATGAPDWRAGDAWTYASFEATAEGNVTQIVTLRVEDACLSNGRHTQGILRRDATGPPAGGGPDVTVTTYHPFLHGAVEVLPRHDAWWAACDAGGAPARRTCLANVEAVQAYWSGRGVLRFPLEPGATWSGQNVTWMVVDAQPVDTEQATYDATRVRFVLSERGLPHTTCTVAYAPAVENVARLDCNDNDGVTVRRDVLITADVA